jgi:hypothetical protein
VLLRPAFSPKATDVADPVELVIDEPVPADGLVEVGGACLAGVGRSATA